MSQQEISSPQYVAEKGLITCGAWPQTAPVHLNEGKRNWTRLQSCQPEECWPQTAFSPTFYQRKGKEVLKIGLILFKGENVGNDYCKHWLAVALRDQILEKK